MTSNERQFIGMMAVVAGFIMAFLAWQIDSSRERVKSLESTIDQIHSVEPGQIWQVYGGSRHWKVAEVITNVVFCVDSNVDISNREWRKQTYMYGPKTNFLKWHRRVE